MTGAKWFQLIGAAFELGGLITVAVGLVNTRRAFTDKPPLLKTLMGILQRVNGRIVRLFTRRRGEQHAGRVSFTGNSGSFGRFRGIAVPGFRGTSAERQEQAEQYIKKHAEAIQTLRHDLTDEQDARAKERERFSQEIAEAEARLTRRIADAVAGGLTLETWGLAAFIIGLVLQAVGDMVQ